MVEELIVHVAFLDLGATLHEPLDAFVDFFILSHLLKTLLYAVCTRETPEIEISIIFNDILRESCSFQLS